MARLEFKPVEFVPVTKVFTPMVEIHMLKDVSGWASKKREGKKWHMAAGSRQTIDEDRAREFVAKGYAKFVDPRMAKRKPLSEDELAELRGSVTVLSPGSGAVGGNNG